MCGTRTARTVEFVDVCLKNFFFFLLEDFVVLNLILSEPDCCRAVYAELHLNI